MKKRHSILSLTASELVRFSRGFYPTWSDQAAEKYARLLEIPMNQRFEKLSNGNQTKVFLLLALSQGADLLILDEPTTALDPITVDQLMHILVEDVLDRGCTIFFSSHQLEEVEKIVEYAGIIDHGKLLMEARLDDIKSEFRVITAAGNSLPTKTSSQVLSVEVDGDFYRYVVTKDAEGFAAGLSGSGATVTNIAPLRLQKSFCRWSERSGHVRLEMLARHPRFLHRPCRNLCGNDANLRCVSRAQRPT